MLGLVALILFGCAKPGGIYRGYEGPERNLKDIAVVDWTGSGVSVTHIDGIDVHEVSPMVTGIRNTIAHLPPGQHALRLEHPWEDLYYKVPIAKVPNNRFLILRADFSSSVSYRLLSEPCKDCNPFRVHFKLIDARTEEVIAGQTLSGTGRYGLAREAEVMDCKRKCWDEYPLYMDHSAYVREKREECEDDCEPFSFFKW